jgi:hypothetical protein
MASVVFPDSSITPAAGIGTMRVSMYDEKSSQRVIIPLTNTLFVPSLKKTLWSVTQFASQGQIIIFGMSDVTIIIKLM